MTRAEDIKFSVKPTTLRDQILLQRIQKSDMEAVAELIVRRSDPPVTLEDVGDIETDDLPSVMTRLSESLSAAISLDSLIRKALD